MTRNKTSLLTSTEDKCIKSASFNCYLRCSPHTVSMLLPCLPHTGPTGDLHCSHAAPAPPPAQTVNGNSVELFPHSFHTVPTQSPRSQNTGSMQLEYLCTQPSRSHRAGSGTRGKRLEKSRWFGDWRKHLGFGRNYRQARKRCSPHKHTYSGPEDHVSEPAQSQLEAPGLPLAGGLLVAVRGQESAGWG